MRHLRLTFAFSIVWPGVVTCTTPYTLPALLAGAVVTRTEANVTLSFPCTSLQNSSKGRRRHSRKTEPESEESDSDPDQLTSSRTESSNQLDAKMKHSKDLDVAAGGPGDHGYNPNHYMRSIPGLIYHGTQSSTSSDLSPMSEQKSLPRRGRSRYHHLHLHNTNTTPRHKSSKAQSPIASPRSSCQNDNVPIQLPRMPSQFRPIHSSRTIGSTNSRLSPNC